MLDQISCTPNWWRGLTRSERTEDGTTPSISEEQRDYGRRRREAWRGGYIVRDADIRLDRWERLGLTEDRIMELLAEPAEALVARLPDRPDWLNAVSEAWRRFGSVRLDDLGIGDPRADCGHDSHDGQAPHEHAPYDQTTGNVVFLNLIAPLLAWSRDELACRVTELSARHRREERLPPSHTLLQPPLDRLLQMILSVMVLEVNVARLEGRLAGATPGERMASFVEHIREPATALRMLAEYPVLARELVACLRTAVNVRAEFTERLLTDLPELRQTFGGTWHGLADLAHISFGAGDTHRGGRTVAILTFTDGRKLVYKPRSLRVEVHFNQVLDWLNARGLRHQLRPLRVLDRGEYGWVEHVDTASCDHEDQVDRFFWRQGAYLALFYALCGSDMHLENVIAAGEHPVLVDLEAIFQVPPRLAGDQPAPLSLGDAPRVVRDSVLRVGLLPERIITVDEEGIYDAEVSGLAGVGGQLSPGRMPTFVGSGTDEVRVVRDRREMPETQNLVRLAGRQVDALAHIESLAAGFTECYRIIETHRDDLLAAEGPIAGFGDDEVRFIPRPTMTYGRVQMESWHPDLLRDALDREIFFEVLSSGFVDLPDRDVLLASEQRQLADQDIPSFHTTPDSTDLFDSYGVVAHDFLETTGLDAVRARIGAMSEEDLRRQLWCIRASMSGLTVGTSNSGKGEPRPLPDAEIAPDLAIRGARVVADLLLDAALTADGKAPSWLSVNFVGDRFWKVGHAGLDLYSGVPGVALFLAQLAAVTGDPRYRRPAEQLAQQLADTIEHLSPGEDRGAGLAIGGFSELGGLIYVLTRLSEILREPTLVEAARHAATMCHARFAEDKVLDVISGTAGAALAILALHRAHPHDRTFDAIKAAGTTIAARAVDVPGGTAWRAEFEDSPALLGFSHGASGIAYALALIAQVTGEGRLAELCGRALRYERHHLSPERRNWPDLRTISGPGAFMNAWCHGAGGVGLARAAMLRLPVLSPWHDLIREDLVIATGRVRDDLVVDGRYTGIGNDSICHGDLGLAETLLAAGSVLGEPDDTVLGRRCARAVAEQVLAGAPRPGVPQRVSTPGLLMGLAGIGYGLLRAAMPERVPNVLLLEAPCHGGEPGRSPVFEGTAEQQVAATP
ncbi:type 2 lantipeptide synthetase LanM family protein [Streptomyces sp. LX-29]|uniref:type 2 lanthipeptide synthetase LanM family protein n=1 Tax=Streptomyces sp. LX-29 TaxID=2900152 RepID=UPI00240D6170|nr:type 2 lanthipeptide synthetase LanM family protein [Streptomyces sp. LX-29]WFB11310.1 type 2 lantipeptide synthetase LanM family protein [Streptomyces sp. LX-29]